MTSEPMLTTSKALYTRYINYRLNSEVAITFRCHLCSTHYQPVQIEKCLKSNYVIKVANMKIQAISIAQRKPSCATIESYFSLSAKMN